MAIQPKNEDWDPEYTPKSRKYYLVGQISSLINFSHFWLNHLHTYTSFSLPYTIPPSLFRSLTQHDDREGEVECKWTDHRGRGRGSFSRGRARFIIRKATAGPNSTCSKWAHDKFHVNGEQGGTQEEETEQDHKEGEINGGNTWASKQSHLRILTVLCYYGIWLSDFIHNNGLTNAD